MNYLTSLYNQARDLFMSLTPQARVMAILMTGVILVSLAFLVQGTNTKSMEYVFNGYPFSDEELQQAEMAFGAAKLSDYEIDHSRIKIPRKLRDTYVKALGDASVLPTDIGEYAKQGISGGTFLDGPAIQKERLLNAKINSLRAAIKKVGVIKDAWITYDEQKEGFGRATKKAATVMIWTRNKRALGSEHVSAIAQWITKTFAGLKYEDVKIISGDTLVVSDPNLDPNVTEQGKQLALKHQYEQDIRTKAIALLSRHDPRVDVHVSVELEPSREYTESIVYEPKSSAVVNSTVTSKTSSSPKGGNGGRPGAAPNAGLSVAPPPTNAATDAMAKTEETSEARKSIPGSKRSLFEKDSFAIKSATMAVIMPESFYEAQWRARNPAANDPQNPLKPDANAITQVKQAVNLEIENLLTQLLPPEKPGEDKYKRVMISSVLDTPTPEMPAETFADTATAWLSNSWQSVALIVLAFVALFMLRSAVSNQGRPRDEEFTRGFGVNLDEAISGGDLNALMAQNDSDDEEGEPTDDNAAGRRFNLTGEKVKEDLSQIVRDNPSAAVNILRSWISDAA